ncbi:MAG: FlgO family outer membrane protein [Rhodanobacteraceae bacterium]
MNSPASSTGGVDGDRVRTELQRILAGEVFSSAPILSRFLGYLVEHRIAGSEIPPKEYAIAVDVFRRGDDFDPQVDTIVRVQARRLRKRLCRYYEDEGRADPLCFTIPKGHYQVEIAEQARVQAVPEEPRGDRAQAGPKSGMWRRLGRHGETLPPHARRLGGAAVGVVVLIALIAAGAYWRVGRGQRVTVRHSVVPSVVATRDVHAASAPSPKPVGSPIATRSVPRRSVAVLPFVNESGQEDQRFFSDGLSEDLITALSQASGLTVINRDSSFRFRHSTDSVKAIAKKLGVTHLLEGSVQRGGDEVRINVELVDAADGRVVWSQRYSRPYKDLFTLQDDITREVVVALKARWLSRTGATRQTDRPPSGSLAAYDAMLRGRFLADQDNQAGLRAAAPYEERAIHLDPNYAYAWAELARIREALAMGFPVGKDEAQTLERGSRMAARKALELAPDLAVAHVAQGLILLNFDWNLAGAASELQRAARLAPQNARVLTYSPIPLFFRGHFSQAAGMWRRAAVLNPLSADIEANLGNALAAARDFPAAGRAFRRAVALQPRAISVHALLARVQVLEGSPAAAVATAKQETGAFWRAWALALAYWADGDRAKSNAELQRMVDQYADADGSEIATIYAQRGQPDQALDWLRHAVATRDPGVLGTLGDPLLARYAHEPGYIALERKLGLIDERGTSTPPTVAAASSSSGPP